MTKFSLIFTIICLLISITCFGETVRDISKPLVLDLQGETGFDGRDGEDASVVDCSLYTETIDGDDGEDGANGEIGDNGEDLFVFESQISKLALLTVNQEGGTGGIAGSGGSGSRGCRGGGQGHNGISGKPGERGELGKFYLLSSDFRLLREKKSAILNLSEFNGLDFNLSENIWHTRSGLKSLLNPDSIVREYYYTFKEQKSYSIEIVMDENSFTPNVPVDTRIALSLSHGELTLNSYTGSVLEYTIEKDKNKFIIFIHKLIAEHHIQNLKLKRISSSETNLQLELRQRNPISSSVTTSFILSIAIIENNQITSESKFIQVPASLIYKTRNSYFIEIGKLRLPAAYKKKGTKIKIYLSVYREFRNQTRVGGIEGIFRI